MRRLTRSSVDEIEIHLRAFHEVMDMFICFVCYKLVLV